VIVQTFAPVPAADRRLLLNNQREGTGSIKYFCVLLAASTLSANARTETIAPWLPLSSASMQHPEPVHTTLPIQTHIAPDGAIFAEVDVTHHNLAHAALARFNADGSFAWMHEVAGSTPAGFAFLDGGHVVTAATSLLTLNAINVRVYDTATGALTWVREATGGRFAFDERNDTKQVAVDANGNVMVLSNDGGDYVVIRHTADGTALPSWRARIDNANNVRASGIVAMPDGGAIVTGGGAIWGGGFVTVRFDAQGDVVFTDVELGGKNSLGNPLGPDYIAVNADGNVMLAGTLETQGGTGHAQVWKLDPSGARLWTQLLPNPGGTLSTPPSVGAFLLAPNGDALVLSKFVGSYRLVRLAAANGAVIWDAAASGGSPSTLAQAENGRILAGGYVLIGGGQVRARAVEFDATGAKCRIMEDIKPYLKLKANGSAAGWSVLTSNPLVAGVGSDAQMRRYNADGPCTEKLFGDGFEAFGSLQPADQTQPIMPVAHDQQ